MIFHRQLFILFGHKKIRNQLAIFQEIYIRLKNLASSYELCYEKASLISVVRYKMDGWISSDSPVSSNARAEDLSILKSTALEIT